MANPPREIGRWRRKLFTQCLVVEGGEVVGRAVDAVEGAEGDGVDDLVPEGHLLRLAVVAQVEGEDVPGGRREGQEVPRWVHLQ